MIKKSESSGKEGAMPALARKSPATDRELWNPGVENYVSSRVFDGIQSLSFAHLDQFRAAFCGSPERAPSEAVDKIRGLLNPQYTPG